MAIGVSSRDTYNPYVDGGKGNESRRSVPRNGPGIRSPLARFSIENSQRFGLGKKSLHAGATEREPLVRVGSLTGSLTQRPGPVAGSESYKEIEPERRDIFSKKSHNEYISVIDNIAVDNDDQDSRGQVKSPTEGVRIPTEGISIPGLEAMSARVDAMGQTADIVSERRGVLSPRPDVMMSPRGKRSSISPATGSLFGSRRL